MASSHPNFGSSFFVAFKLTHEALDAALKNASDLSITQYRVLVKLLTAGEAGLPQKEVGALLDLKPNVVTQAINALVDEGLAYRAGTAGDKRFRRAHATPAGEQHVAHVNAAVVEQLYGLFPTDDESWRKILEASIAAGADIDPPLSPEFSEKYPASRTLVSIELVRIALERGLKDACGAPLSDCLVMMRLGEASRPLRVNDIAEALEMPTANVTRAVDRLQRRGWVRRMGSDRDRKAVFVVPTAEGEFQGHVIDERSSELGEALLWSKLSPADREAIGDVGEVVIEGLRRRRAEQKNVGFDDLRPLD